MTQNDDIEKIPLYDPLVHRDFQLCESRIVCTGEENSIDDAS